MLRTPSVEWQKSISGSRLVKTNGLPGVSYCELRTTNGTLLGVGRSNVSGIFAFDTAFSGSAILFPITLKGTVYQNGILISAVAGSPPIYTVSPPLLSGLVNVASGDFSINANFISTPTTINLLSNLAGTFTPSSILLPPGNSTTSFTYTPTVAGAHALTLSSPLTNPSPYTYVAAAPSGGSIILDTQFVTLTGTYNLPLGGTSNYIIRHLTATAIQTVTFTGTPTQDTRVELINRSAAGILIQVETPPDGVNVAFLDSGTDENKLVLDYDFATSTWFGVVSNG